MHPEMVDAIARVRPTFSVNALAQRAALGALANQTFLQSAQRLNRAGIVQITRTLERHCIEWIPTHANFIAIRLSDARAVAQRLLQAGVVVRPLGAYALDDFIRVSIGTEDENAAFLKALLNAVEPA